MTAALGPVAMEESVLLDLLECPVCLERLDASAKVLPCQHTFCRRCLLGIVGSRPELRCPECRTLVGTPVDALPSNILLVRLLDGIKQRPRRPGPAPPAGLHPPGPLRGGAGVAPPARVGLLRRVPGEARVCEHARLDQEQVHGHVHRRVDGGGR